MESDGKAVHLILNALEEEKFLRIARQLHHLKRISKEQFMGLVLVIFFADLQLEYPSPAPLG